MEKTTFRHLCLLLEGDLKVYERNLDKERAAYSITKGKVGEGVIVVVVVVFSVVVGQQQ